MASPLARWRLTYRYSSPASTGTSARRPNSSQRWRATCLTESITLPSPSPTRNGTHFSCETQEVSATHYTRSVTVRVSTLSTTADHRSEEHTSELQSRDHLVCRLPLEKNNHPHHSFSSVYMKAWDRTTGLVRLTTNTT